VLFAIPDKPKRVAVNEEGSHELPMPLVHIILLEVGPERGESETEKMIPSDRFLFQDELMIGLWVRLEIRKRNGHVVKIATEACNEEMDELWVCVNLFRLGLECGYAG
jgi:hypothetical protein